MMVGDFSNRLFRLLNYFDKSAKHIASNVIVRDGVMKHWTSLSSRASQSGVDCTLLASY